MRSKLTVLLSSMLVLMLMLVNGGAYGQSCQSLLDLGFSEDHLKDMKNACFNNNTPYQCMVLKKTIGGKTQFITLIGEYHNQGPESFALGAKLLQHYGRVGLEPNPVMRLNNKIASASEPITKYLLVPPAYQNSLLGYRNKNQQIVNLEEGGEYLDSAARKMLLSLVAKYTAVPGLSCLSSSLGLPLSMGSIAKLIVYYTFMTNYAKVNREYDYSVSPEGMYKRDKFMVSNIALSTTPSASSTTAMASVMGAAHLYGVFQLLKNENFEDIDLKDCYEDRKGIKVNRIPFRFERDELERGKFYKKDDKALSIEQFLNSEDKGKYSDLLSYTANDENHFAIVDKKGTYYTTIKFSHPSRRDIQFRSGEIDIFLQNLQVKKAIPSKGSEYYCGLYKCTDLSFDNGNKITVYSSDADFLIEQFK